MSQQSNLMAVCCSECVWCWARRGASCLAWLFTYPALRTCSNQATRADVTVLRLCTSRCTRAQAVQDPGCAGTRNRPRSYNGCREEINSQRSRAASPKRQEITFSLVLIHENEIRRNAVTTIIYIVATAQKRKNMATTLRTSVSGKSSSGRGCKMDLFETPTPSSCHAHKYPTPQVSPCPPLGRAAAAARAATTPLLPAACVA